MSSIGEGDDDRCCGIAVADIVLNYNAWADSSLFVADDRFEIHEDDHAAGGLADH
jgi:hypothetical protein